MKKIRYAVVGLGYFAQIAVLPAFKNARNAELTALVSGDRKKLKELGNKYRVKNLYSYEKYEECLKSGEIDAVYIALPNDMHREYTELAAKYGKHVLCEKPMAVTEEDCAAMVQAAQENNVRLMIAYRLHFEEANLEAIQLIKSGKLGDVRAFDSVFAMPVKEKNIRTRPRSEGGGPLYDIGIYCLNASRYIFQEEPIEVMAMATRAPKSTFKNIDETVSVMMKFPKERIATFTCTFGAADEGTFRVVGTKGSLMVKDAFGFVGEKTHIVTIGGKAKEKTFKSRDQIAPELIYFSDCIHRNRNPEPSGIEGLADVRLIEAIFRSIDTGRSVRIEERITKERPGLKQKITQPAVKEPKLIRAEEPSQEKAA